MERTLKFPNFCRLLPKKDKSKNNYLLVLDIGTEFVKALVLEISQGNENKGQKGIVTGIGRQRQSIGQMRAGAVADIDGVALTCQEAIKQAVSAAGIRPKKAVIGISGEFIKGSSANFSYKREKSQKAIDLAEIKNIIQKTQWKALDKMRRELSLETSQSEIEIKLINALITEIRIDGYQVSNPLGFQGKEIFLSIFNVYAPLLHLNAVEAIASKLNLQLLSVIAEPYALARSICPGGNSVPVSGAFYESSVGHSSAENAIFIDVGGGTTDIALVRRGGVEGIKSLTLAGRAFTRRLSQSLDLGLNEAEEVKIRYSCQQLSHGVQRRIREILKNDADVWLKGIELILEEFNQGEFYPSSVLLCGGGSLLPEIENALKESDIQQQWLDKFPFSQTPKVNFIKSEHIDNIIDQSNTLKGPEYITPIALANLSLEISNSEKNIMPPIMRRVVRMMMRR